MKLEQQVVSLELAKQLEELNVKQGSLFYWCSYTHFVEGEMVTDWLLESKESMKVKGLDVGLTYSAFTVAELGEMLPDRIWENMKPPLSRARVSYWIITGKDDDGWFCAYNKPQGGKANYIHLITEQTEADARAKMLIWLVENKYL